VLYSSILYSMKTTLIYITIFTLGIAQVSYIKAMEDDVRIENRPIQQGRADIRENRKEARTDVQTIRQDRREDVKEIRESRDGKRTASSSAEIKTIREEARVKVEARRADLKVEVQAIKASSSAARTKKLDDKAKLRVQNTIDAVYKRLITSVNTLTKVDGEISRRIASSTKSSSELATAVTLQTTAKDLLAKAKVDVEATKATASAEVNASTTKEVIRALVKKSEVSIKTAAEAYKKVSAELKRVNRPVTASSTN
jgi:hypothetical protein